LTPGDYILGDLGEIHTNHKVHAYPSSVNRRPSESWNSIVLQEVSHLERQRSWSTFSPKEIIISESLDFDSEIDPDLQEELEAKRARIQERKRVHQILERRSKRLQRGVLRELWSCFVED
jgi:yeast amino acid transporter